MGTVFEPAAAINLEEVETTGQLPSLQTEWAQLWARCPEATPFQSPEWLVPLWNHLGEGDPWILALRRQGRLVGLAPFVIRGEQNAGKRHLLLLGTGVTDYLDLLLEPAFAIEGASAVLGFLKANCHRWDVADFQQLRSGSSLLEVEPPSDWSGQITVQEVCPVLNLPEKLQELPRLVPSHMLEKLRYYRRRFQQFGPLRVESARLDNFAELFERFASLHQAQWTARGKDGVLREPRVQRFNREAAERMLISGMLRLYVLRKESEVIAGLYALAHRDRTYYYLSGFDPAYAAFSPGTLLIGHAIEEAIRESRAHFDFLRGRETYKYLWGAKGRLNYRRQFWHAGR